MDDHGLYAAKIANYALLGASVLHTLTLAKAAETTSSLGAYLRTSDVERLKDLERLLDSTQRGAKPLLQLRHARVLPGGAEADDSHPFLLGYAARDLKTFDLIRDVRSLANDRVDLNHQVDVEDPQALLNWVVDTRELIADVREALTGGSVIDHHKWDQVDRWLVPFLRSLAELEPAEVEFAQEWRELCL